MFGSLYFEKNLSPYYIKSVLGLMGRERGQKGFRGIQNKDDMWVEGGVKTILNISQWDTIGTMTSCAFLFCGLSLQYLFFSV